MLNNIKTKGFTLLEVLVAVFVLVTGVLAVFTVIQNTTFYSQTASLKLTATYLAQEGIEIVRNQRDSNWLAKVDWDSNLSNTTTTGLLGKFDRVTTITPDGSGDKITVSVEVSWQEKGKAQPPVTAQTELYNWK